MKRLIEVKGVQGIWDGDATVAMTGPQFDAARAEQSEGVEYWLYVVDRVGSPEAKVYPLRLRATLRKLTAFTSSPRTGCPRWKEKAHARLMKRCSKQTESRSTSSTTY